MSETPVTFPARGQPEVILEGRLLDGGGRPCIVSHPHPLGGGDMTQPVVVALWRAAAAAGFRALRYNFRGVGASTGELEPDATRAIDDLAGAIDFLGGGPVLAIGYSYGARATLHGIGAGLPIERAALVGLPTRVPANRAALSNLVLGRRIRSEQHHPNPDLHLAASLPQRVRVIVGDRDPLVERDVLQAHGLEPVWIEGVNHFFSRRLGNQPPDPTDLDTLCENAIAWLAASG